MENPGRGILPGRLHVDVPADRSAAGLGEVEQPCRVAFLAGAAVRVPLADRPVLEPDFHLGIERLVSVEIEHWRLEADVHMGEAAAVVETLGHCAGSRGKLRRRVESIDELGEGRILTVHTVQVRPV